MSNRDKVVLVKEMASMLRRETRLPHDFPYDLIDWLVEQAERVPELERELAQFSGTNWNMAQANLELEKQNKRYREAIKETLQAMGMVDRQKYGKALERVLEDGE